MSQAWNFQNRILVFTMILLASCSSETVPESYKNLGFDSIQGEIPKISLSPVNKMPESACRYLEDLRGSQEPSQGSFQFFDQFYFDGQQVVGSFRFAHLPQARWEVSQENSMNQISPIRVLTQAEYADLLTQKICKDIYPYCDIMKIFGEKQRDLEDILNSTKTPVLVQTRLKLEAELKNLQLTLEELRKRHQDKVQILENLELDFVGETTLWRGTVAAELELQKRNQFALSAIEERFPGAITGQAGPLNHAPLVQFLMLSLGGRPLRESDTEEAPLTNIYPLLWKDWNARHLDLRISMELMNSEVPVSNVSEKVCQFVLAQRVLAQVLSLKGIHGTPKLSASGRVMQLPQSFNEIVEYEDVLGMYPKVVDSAYIRSLITESDTPEGIARLPRAQGAETTAGLIDSLRFFTALGSKRTERLWFGTQEQLQAGRVQLPYFLMNLSFSLLGVGLKTFNGQELDMPDTTTLRFKGQDFADNLAKLGRLSVEMVSGLSSLHRFDDLGRQVLGSIELDMYLASFEQNGILAKVKNLQTVIVLEGVDRFNRRVGSETLLDTIHVLGEHMDNDYLRTFNGN